MCMFEPDTDEFVQVTYLCGMDSHISENELLDCLGGIKNVGLAQDKEFMELGLFPLSVIYERNGVVKREKENPMDGFQKVSDNVYMPIGNGVNIVCRMYHLKNKTSQRKKAAI